MCVHKLRDQPTKPPPPPPRAESSESTSSMKIIAGLGWKNVSNKGIVAHMVDWLVRLLLKKPRVLHGQMRISDQRDFVMTKSQPKKSQRRMTSTTY